MQMFLAAVLFAATGLAMPAGSFSCPGGLTNSAPMCCSAYVLGLAGLDCKTPGANGCEQNGKPGCCTLGLAGQGVLCNAL
ncbi:hypothetical protein NLG97_g9128 [Lecanicillium saksenae]|uniref:Uncharacterized protein n=1 Tax=Lecanicillium saksenae TaxID=468837 RepID=A0ACC1QJD0_9HYPO|nr:hypothetical protein NLG97_g9128 [Lecanicillium saksenae]